MGKRAKYPVVVTTDNRKDLGSRRDFELQRSEKDAWKPVSWTSLKKAAQEETGTRRPRVDIVLRAALDNEWIDKGQDFGYDSAGALRVAKMLIRDGLADSVYVDAMYFRPFSQREHRTAHDLFRLERGEGSFGPRKKTANSGSVTNPIETKRALARCMR